MSDAEAERLRRVVAEQRTLALRGCLCLTLCQCDLPQLPAGASAQVNGQPQPGDTKAAAADAVAAPRPRALPESDVRHPRHAEFVRERWPS